MKMIDWILLGIVLIVVILAVRAVVLKKKNGGGCCGSSGCRNCAQCSISSMPKRETEKEA